MSCNISSTATTPYVPVALLDYNQELQTDDNLKLLVNQLPEEANREKPNLGKYRIGPTTLTILNFTSYGVKVDEQRRLFFDDLKACSFTADDCHAIFYGLKKESHPLKVVRSLEKDDDSDKIQSSALEKIESGWRDVQARPLSDADFFLSFQGRALSDFESTLMRAFYPEDEVEAHYINTIKKESSLVEKVYRLYEAASLISQQLHSTLGQENKNVCLSPIALLQEVCMIAESMPKEAAENFFYSLRLQNITREELYAGFKLIKENLITANISFPRLTVSGLISEIFAEKIRQSYGAEILSHVQQTQDRIINQSSSKDNSSTLVDSSTTFLSAINFIDAWKMPFPAELTTPLPFYLENGEVTTVPTMRLLSPMKLKWCQFGDDYSMVEIPLHISNSGDHSCLLFLPNPSSIWTLQNSLNMRMIKFLRESAIYRNITLQLPKIEMRVTTEDVVTPLLKGWPKQIQGINPALAEIGEKTHLGKVIHQSSINFVENDAVTEGQTDSTQSNEVAKEEILPFIVDHPFVYVILYKDTIVVQGTVKEASAFSKSSSN